MTSARLEWDREWPCVHVVFGPDEFLVELSLN